MEIHGGTKFKRKPFFYYFLKNMIFLSGHQIEKSVL